MARITQKPTEGQHWLSQCQLDAATWQSRPYELEPVFRGENLRFPVVETSSEQKEESHGFLRNIGERSTVTKDWTEKSWKLPSPTPSRDKIRIEIPESPYTHNSRHEVQELLDKLDIKYTRTKKYSRITKS